MSESVRLCNLIDRYEDDLEDAYQRYITDINEIALRARSEVLLPYLKANGYEFTTGNGTYSIADPGKITYRANGSRDWRNYDYDMLLQGVPDIIDRVLHLEVEGSQGNGELGLWMLDYTTRKTKNGGGQK